MATYIGVQKNLANVLSVFVFPEKVNQYALSRQQNDCNCTQCTAAHHKKTPAGHWPPPTFTLVRRLRISKLKHRTIMERLMGRESPNKDSRRSSSLQKQVVENRRRFSHRPAEPVPDVAELMDDWFFGSGNVKSNQNKNYLTTSAGAMDDDHQEQQVLLEDSPRNSNSRMTQEWLEEAKRIVAESPTRYDSPSRLVGSPRFASSSGPSDLDRRDPLSRSARRHRGREGFSGEILSRSAKHSRNKSESLEGQGIGEPDSPQWFANNLGHQTLADQLKQPNSKEEEQPLDQTIQGKPPRLPVRKSRFQEIPITTQSVGSSPTMPRRNFRSSSSSGQLNDDQHQLLLSPPKSLTEPAHRRSLSSSTSNEDKLVLSPPRRLVESIQRRSISSSTCSIDKIPSRQDSKGIMSLKKEDVNMFLKEQRSKMYGISSGEIHDVKAKIVLSGSSNSTSSMVAAICYAWLLDRRIKDNKEDGRDGAVVIPVMNMRRGRMWKQKQAAWLLHNTGVDASSLLFTDEVDLESLMMARKLSIMVVGQDVLNTKDEVYIDDISINVGSQCTILTDNYCEDAYDLLQNPSIKKLLLAGILLDTQNLNAFAKISMNRDAEAVQLLLVGYPPNYRNTLFDQLTQDHRDTSFVEALHQNYGKSPSEKGDQNRALVEQHRVSARNSTSTPNQGTRNQATKSPNGAKPSRFTTQQQQSAATKSKPVPAAAAAAATKSEPAPRNKNAFFLARWFGFGSK